MSLSYRNVRGPRAFALALAIAVCVTWLWNTWSPSHYGLVLHGFGAADDGLILGTPRFVLSDEWSQTTPLIQATVNNGLQRYNKTSFYGEDLRIVYSMPVLDWGMLFKPDKWLYPFVNAAYAFSFQWLFYLCAFVVGYTLLLRRLGLAMAEAAAVTLVLFFTAFVQFWWVLYAPTLALFPWVLLALDIERPWLRFAVMLWVSVSWMLGHFYPPLVITLAIVGAAVVYRLHVDQHKWSRLIVPALAVLGACALVSFYLWDTLAATWMTNYPGRRRLDGGGVQGATLAQLVWPNAYLRDFQTTLPNSIPYGDFMAGTYYTLMTAVFLDYRRAFGDALDASVRRYMLALLASLGILVAWQVLPIPKEWVGWTGLPFVVPTRLGFATGVAMLLLAAAANAAFGMRFSFARFAVFCAIVLFGWGVTKSVPAGADANAWSRAWPDLAIIPLAALTFLRPRWIEGRRHLIVAACCAAWGAVAFGGFNPLQSAWPIFNRQPTTMTELLDYRVRHAQDGVIAGDKAGAVLNGLGYRSVAHILFVPPLAMWHRLFPELDAATFDAIFNRFCHIVVIDEPAPRGLPNYVTGVPRSLFERDVWTLDVKHLHGKPEHVSVGGQVNDRIRQDDGRVLVRGWAPWHALTPEQTLTLYSSSDVRVVHFERIARDDIATVMKDPTLRFSGFAAWLEFGSADGGAQSPALCFVAQESALSPRVLVGTDDKRCLDGSG